MAKKIYFVGMNKEARTTLEGYTKSIVLSDEEKSYYKKALKDLQDERNGAVASIPELSPNASDTEKVEHARKIDDVNARYDGYEAKEKERHSKKVKEIGKLRTAVFDMLIPTDESGVKSTENATILYSAYKIYMTNGNFDRLSDYFGQLLTSWGFSEIANRPVYKKTVAKPVLARLGRVKTNIKDAKETGKLLKDMKPKQFNEAFVRAISDYLIEEGAIEGYGYFKKRSETSAEATEDKAE